MVFSSAYFLYAFLPVVIILYYIIDRRLKNVFLLLVSLIFYGWGEPKYIKILLISMFLNYLFAILVEKHQKKFLLVLAIVYNIGNLFVFKYLNFTIYNLEKILNIDVKLREFVLPIGISFYTFQAMSYIIDVYRGKTKALKNPIDMGLYISFFPQLVAGPIVRFEVISSEINNRKETWEDFRDGVVRFVTGLSKKVVLSNSLAVISDYYFGMEQYSNVSVLGVWIGSICYTLQIYFDFSGYSDMAIGLGKMFGFNFPENFNYPYISKNITEFWRRWHITLSSWFRDYVYIPLGGNRVSKHRHIINLFVVWMLTGMWHGASWNFILWGELYFIFLMFEKMFGIPDKLKRGVWQIVYRFITLMLINFSWIIFRADNLVHVKNYLKAMFGLFKNCAIDSTSLFILNDIKILLIISIICCMPWMSWIENKLKNNFIKNAYEIIRGTVIIGLFIVSSSYCVNGTYNPFIYFNF